MTLKDACALICTCLRSKLGRTVKMFNICMWESRISLFFIFIFHNTLSEYCYKLDYYIVTNSIGIARKDYSKF